MTEILRQQVNQALAALGLAVADFWLGPTADLSHGDYSSNVALVLAQAGQRAPRALAETIVVELKKSLPTMVATVEPAGPGFINFRLTKDFFSGEIKKVIQEKTNYGRGTTLANQKIMVEYTDPNPFKEFHIGHLMS
ncbi:MAG: arginine--tRNA ligase, partial [Patescibacteria group bacterium]